MKLKIFQKGFNYSQDGTGNRLVYHLQGCNMKCPWCANPEGMLPYGVIITEKEWLIDSLCPKGAVKDGQLDRRYCETCEKRECITGFRSKGLRFSCQEYEVDDIVREVIRSRPLFYDGGGITLTGGEVTMQMEAVLELLQEVHEMGIHTAIETNASHLSLKNLFPYVDELIMDCKLCDDRKHQKYTGLSAGQTMENIRKAAQDHPRVHIRVPLIGGVNDSEEDERLFLEFFKEIQGPNVTFELLKYHEFGKAKWEQCGWEYQMDETAHVTDARIRSMKQHMTEQGLNYRRT